MVLTFHSIIIKEDVENLYVYCQPKEIWVNNDVGPYSYPEVWIYKKDGNFSSNQPRKISLKRNKNLWDAGSLINHDTFYIEDLDKDGKMEIIVGMFKMPFSDEHFSIHVFDEFLRCLRTASFTRVLRNPGAPACKHALRFHIYITM